MWSVLHALLLALPLGSGGSPAEPRVSALPRAMPRTQMAPRPIEELRVRLKARPAAERERLEHHLDEFEKLPPPARAKLLQRARTLREREQALPATPRSEAEARPAERQARLRAEIRAQGGEVRGRLPEALRKRLEKAAPEERRRLLERLARERERLSRAAIHTMTEQLPLEPHEVQRLERLPVDQRLRAMRELSRAARPQSRAQERPRPSGG